VDKSQILARAAGKAGYTQESFGDACGVHRNLVGAIERGEQNLRGLNAAPVLGEKGSGERDEWRTASSAERF